MTMAGRCYSCASAFSVFKKEVGCKNCGFSFCKDCLTKKAEIPKFNNKKYKVCNKCYGYLSGHFKPEEHKNYSPPEAFKRRLAAMKEQDMKSKKDVQLTRQNVRNMAKYRGLSEEDVALAQRLEFLKESRRKSAEAVPSQQEMEERLEKLKEGLPPPPSSQDMSERLAVLRGQDPAKATKPSALPQDRRHVQEQIDDLLEEICDEVAIDNRQSGRDGMEDSDHDMSRLMAEGSARPGETGDRDVSMQEMQHLIKQIACELHVDANREIENLAQDKELQHRLQEMKKSSLKSSSDSEEDELETTRKIIKQYMEESALEQGMSDTGTAKVDGCTAATEAYTEEAPGFIPDPDELPWCCICNNDAVLRCFGCDDDLYCHRCFAEGHDNFNMNDHPTARYRK